MLKLSEKFPLNQSLTRYSPPRHSKKTFHSSIFIFQRFSPSALDSSRFLSATSPPILLICWHSSLKPLWARHSTSFNSMVRFQLKGHILHQSLLFGVSPLQPPLQIKPQTRLCMTVTQQLPQLCKGINDTSQINRHGLHPDRPHSLQWFHLCLRPIQ